MTDDNEMFMTLFQYIDGANSENENIDMTTPVSTKWQEDGFHEECFYLNQEHQANPPKPNSPNVYIVVRPAMTVYTRFVILKAFVFKGSPLTAADLGSCLNFAQLAKVWIF